MHLMRVFFTGAFRKPRELTWLVGLMLLFTALLEGYLGYSLVDDLLSGMGLAIGYGVGLSIPVDRRPADAGDLRGAVPGQGRRSVSRMYIAHVFLIPILLATLIGIHLALIAARHHTQFRESRRHDRAPDRRRAAVPRPGAALAGADVLRRRRCCSCSAASSRSTRSGSGARSRPWLGTNGAQPDWYLGWLIGALRLMPSFDVTIGHFTLVPNPFWGGVAVPAVRARRARRRSPGSSGG